jgi:hypothetical protein
MEETPRDVRLYGGERMIELFIYALFGGLF